MLYINQVTFYLKDMVSYTKHRTIVVFYENSTAYVAMSVIEMLSKSHCKTDSIWMTLNVDHNNGINYLPNIGRDIFNICIFENVSNIIKHGKIHDKFDYDPSFKNIYLSSKHADDLEIIDFFKHLWKENVLNGGLILWNGIFKIYTYSPFQRKFCVQLFERAMVGEGLLLSHLPANVLNALFRHDDTNLGNTSYKVFMKEDPPKIFRVPNRFRNSSQFYFSGRDGRAAFIAQRILHSYWLYRTIPVHYNLINFKERKNDASGKPVDLWGRPVPPDNAPVPNLDILNFTDKSILA